MILRKIYPLKISTLISPFFRQQPVADIRILFWVPKLSVQINDKQLRKNVICSNLRGVNIIVCRGGSGFPFHFSCPTPKPTLVCHKSDAFLHLEQKIVSSDASSKANSSLPQIRCLLTLRVENSIISIDDTITDNMIRKVIKMFSRKVAESRMGP